MTDPDRERELIRLRATVFKQAETIRAMQETLRKIEKILDRVIEK